MPATAAAQAALDQYIPQEKPKGTGDSGVESAATTSSGAGGGVDGGATAERRLPAAPVGIGADGGGELPGSDYSVTGFVALIAALLVLGLLGRFAWLLVRRAREIG